MSPMKKPTILFLISVCLSAGFTQAKPGPAKHIKAPEAVKLLGDKSAQTTVLDVRTPQEFAEGHVPGAINIDFLAPDFQQKVSALDKSKSYLVHCQSGGRSGKSLEVFKKLGFTGIIHLDGGFSEWTEAGGPEEKK